MREKIQSIIEKYHGDRGRLLDILLDIQAQYQHVPAQAVSITADQLDISQVDVEQVVSFYHFLTISPAGKYAVYLNDSVVAKMMGRDEVALQNLLKERDYVRQLRHYGGAVRLFVRYL